MEENNGLFVGKACNLCRFGANFLYGAKVCDLGHLPCEKCKDYLTSKSYKFNKLAEFILTRKFKLKEK